MYVYVVYLQLVGDAVEKQDIATGMKKLANLFFFLEGLTINTLILWSGSAHVVTNIMELSLAYIYLPESSIFFCHPKYVAYTGSLQVMDSAFWLVEYTVSMRYQLIKESVLSLVIKIQMCGEKGSLV